VTNVHCTASQISPSHWRCVHTQPFRTLGVWNCTLTMHPSRWSLLLWWTVETTNAASDSWVELPDWRTCKDSTRPRLITLACIWLLPLTASYHDSTPSLVSRFLPVQVLQHGIIYRASDTGPLLHHSENIWKLFLFNESFNCFYVCVMSAVH